MTAKREDSCPPAEGAAVVVIVLTSLLDFDHGLLSRL